MIIKIVPLPSGSEAETRGIGFYRTNLINALKKFFPDLKLMADSPGKPGPDLVHYPFFDFFFRTLPLSHPQPVVVTIHDVIPLLFPNHFPPGIRGKLNLLYQKHVLKGVTKIITDSEVSRRDIAMTLGMPEKKIAVVHLAANPEIKKVNHQPTLMKIKRKYHLPEEFLLFVGDLNWNKNILGTLAVAKRLKLPLVVVGKAAKEMPQDPTNPWNRDRVAFINRSQEDQKIICPGFVPTQELAAIYSLATVYLQLSFYEGFGLPLLEAMACECPVVAADTSSLPEVGGEGAIFVDPTNLDVVATIIEKVRKNLRFRSKLIKAGKKQVAKFAWEKTAQDTLAVYQEALKNP